MAVLMPAGPGVFIAEKRCLVCIRGDEERIWNLTIVTLSEDVANALLVPFFSPKRGYERQSASETRVFSSQCWIVTQN